MLELAVFLQIVALNTLGFVAVYLTLTRYVLRGY